MYTHYKTQSSIDYKEQESIFSYTSSAPSTAPPIHTESSWSTGGIELPFLHSICPFYGPIIAYRS